MIKIRRMCMELIEMMVVMGKDRMITVEGRFSRIEDMKPEQR